MRGKIYTAIILIILLYTSACKDDYNYTSQIIISGECFYFDPFLDDTITNEAIEISIKPLSADSILPAGLPNKLTGRTYSFGPLNPGEYEIEATYKDSLNKIRYTGKEIVNTSMESTFIVKNIIMKVSSQTQFIRGQISYYDILADKEEFVPNLEIAEIKSLNDYLQLPNDGNSTLAAPEYMFGPLPNQTYLLNFQYVDKFGLKYSKETSIVMDGSDPMKTESYVLNLEPNTILVTQIVDSLMNGMANVAVYLYNNYAFLKKYKANSEAAIRTSITNKEGKVVFTNLTNTKYFIYGERIISSDTLNTFDPNFEPSDQTNLLENEVNYQQVIAK